MKIIKLSEEDLDKLINGKMIENDGVHIFLADIGMNRILHIAQKAFIEFCDEFPVKNIEP
jgi:hypothetical protein